MFFFLQKNGHLKKKNVLRKLRKMYSVDHNNRFYIHMSKFFTLKDLSKIISYLYFGYLYQKFYLKKKFHEQFLTQNFFFSKIGILTKKNLFGRNVMTPYFEFDDP
jgi:hypothetical protein